MFVGLPFKIRFPISTEKIYTISNECENSFLVSDSAHIEFYTVTPKHTTLVTKKKHIFNFYVAKLIKKSNTSTGHTFKLYGYFTFPD